MLVPDVSVLPKNVPEPSITKSNKRWNTSNKYLRPRIFCLEHCVQIEEMVRSKGGANILVICHSGEIVFSFIFIFSHCRL